MCLVLWLSLEQEVSPVFFPPLFFSPTSWHLQRRPWFPLFAARSHLTSAGCESRDRSAASTAPLSPPPAWESRSWRPRWRKRSRWTGPCLSLPWDRPCLRTSLWAWRWCIPSSTPSSSSSSTCSSGWSCDTDTSASATRRRSCPCACCGRPCAPCSSPSTSRTLSQPTLWGRFPSGCSTASRCASSSSPSVSWTFTLHRWVIRCGCCDGDSDAFLQIM